MWALPGHIGGENWLLCYDVYVYHWTIKKKEWGWKRLLHWLTGKSAFEAESFLEHAHTHPSILWSLMPSHATLAVPEATWDWSCLILCKFWHHYQASSGCTFNIWLAGKREPVHRHTSANPLRHLCVSITCLRSDWSGQRPSWCTEGQIPFGLLREF